MRSVSATDPVVSEVDAVPRSPGTIYYLVSQYPKLSHAFIATEIVGLRERGYTIRTFSVNSPTVEDLDDPRNMSAATDTTFIKRDIRSQLAAIIAFLVRHPLLAVAGLREAQRMSRGSGNRKWVLYFLEAISLLLHLRSESVPRIHVHVHLANNAADIAHLATFLGRRVDSRLWTWSLTVHGPTEFADMTRFGVRAKVESASFVACITDFCRSQILSVCPPEKWSSVGVVRVGIEPQRFVPVDRSGRRGPLRVLFVGRLVPEKAPELLVRAIADVPGTELRIIGSGPQFEPLRALVSELGLAGQVDMVGAIGNHQLMEQYAWADVLCMPSFAEGLPTVIMEAMATGLPVVATRIAGIPELVVDGQNGLLVAASNDRELIAALHAMHDPGLRESLGSRARSAVLARHDYHDSAATLAGLLSQAGT